MSDETPKTKTLRPHQLAWLRRPELDTPGYDAWEMPDGQMVAAPKGKEPLFEKLSAESLRDLRILKRREEGKDAADS